MKNVLAVVLFTAAVLGAGLGSAPAGTVTFSNTNLITINDSDSPPTIATPYPSAIQVTNLNGVIISKVTVSLFGFGHTFPSDVDIVLVGPEGQNAIVFSNVGGSSSTNAVTNLDFTLDDDAADYMPVTNTLFSGTFKPTQGDTNAFLFDFPAPAPKTSDLMGPFLSNFNNTEPNGTWNLFIVDDTASDSGVISNGWSLTFTTSPVRLSILRQQTNAIVSWTNAATGYTLQTTPSLAHPAWTNIQTAPIEVSGQFVITNSITNGTAFYRLIK